MMNKKVFLKAYCYQNLGDDLFVRILAKRYPQTLFYLPMQPRFADSFSDLPNVKPIKEGTLYRGINRLSQIVLKRQLLKNYFQKKVDGSVIVGGSMFIERPQWENSLSSYQDFLIKEKPLFVLGSNFGPSQSLKFYQTYEEFFSKCFDICFRDEYSKEKYNHLEQVRGANDIVFSYPLKPKKKQKQVTIIPIEFDRPALKQYKSAYLEAVSRIGKEAAEQGYRIQFLSFCNAQGDEQAINEIKTMIKKSTPDFESEVLLYDGRNMDTVIDTINRSEFTVTTRFHGMILGWLCKSNVYPIIYDQKMLNTIKTSRYQGAYTMTDQLDTLGFEAVRTNRYELQLAPLIDESQHQFDQLDGFLKGEKHEKI